MALLSVQFFLFTTVSLDNFPTPSGIQKVKMDGKINVATLISMFSTIYTMTRVNLICHLRWPQLHRWLPVKWACNWCDELTETWHTSHRIAPLLIPKSDTGALLPLIRNNVPDSLSWRNACWDLTRRACLDPFKWLSNTATDGKGIWHVSQNTDLLLLRLLLLLLLLLLLAALLEELLLPPAVFEVEV